MGMSAAYFMIIWFQLSWQFGLVVVESSFLSTTNILNRGSSSSNYYYYHPSFRNVWCPKLQSLKISDLFEMDVVSFKVQGSDVEEFGAVQEYGTIAPICTWTLESVMNGSDTLEFLVDEDRPRYTQNEIEILSLLPEEFINGYGSRQVGGGKGPGNPHGEESETLYYIERAAIQDNRYKHINVVVRPELEIIW